MRSFIATTAVALAASSVVIATPQGPREGLAAAHGIIQLPLGDGFPTPNDQQKAQIQDEAFGTLSNLPPPPSLSADTLTSLRLVAFNELFESFFFANFLNQLNNATFMRTIGELNVSPQALRSTIESILAVEELHAINANGALQKVGKVDPIKPCKYIFPVDDVKSATVLANRFTDVVLGTLQDVIFDAAVANDNGFTPGVAATIGDEGEQNGAFRIWLHERPQSQPFLTRSVRDFAFSILQDFVVPGSCPNENQIDLKVFQPLTPTGGDPEARDQQLEFTFDLKPTRFVPPGHKSASPSKEQFKSKWGRGAAWKGLSITYFNGQNLNTEKLSYFHIDGDKVTVRAFFPQEANNIFGLAIATLTAGTEQFTSVADAVGATLFGPAPLEVQEGGSPKGY